MAFRRLLDCGLVKRGFARVVCPSCQYEILVPFSCKVRGLCPSCDGRRMAAGATDLVDHILPVVADYRQWTLSFPRWLRIRLLRDKALVSAVPACWRPPTRGVPASSPRPRSPRNPRPRPPRCGSPAGSTGPHSCARSSARCWRLPSSSRGLANLGGRRALAEPARTRSARLRQTRFEPALSASAIVAEGGSSTKAVKRMGIIAAVSAS